MSDCNPSPCFQPDPLVCVPPPNTSNPKQVVVIDNNGCYRSMQDTTDQMAFLVKDSVTGTLRWVNGSVAQGKGIYLGDVTEGTGASRSLITVNATGSNAMASRPANGEEFPSIPTVLTSGGNIIWQGFKTILFNLFGIAGNQCGVFTRACDDGSLNLVVGTEGQILTMGADGPEFAALSIPQGAQPFGYENLTIETGDFATDTKEATITVSVEKVAVINNAGESVVLNSFAGVGDITLSGAGGLDTGTALANTWYYVFVIWNGAVANVLLSASATLPVLPVGYTYKKLVGVTRTFSTTTLFISKQNNNEFAWGGVNQLAQRTLATNAALSTITNFTSFVAPIAKTWSSSLLIVNSVTSAQIFSTSVIPSVSPTAFARGTVLTSVANGTDQFEVLNVIITSAVPRWSVTAAPGNAYTVTMNAIGFTL